MQIEKLSLTTDKPKIDYMITQYAGLGYKHVETLEESTGKVRMIFEKAIPINQAIPSNK